MDRFRILAPESIRERGRERGRETWGDLILLLEMMWRGGDGVYELII